MRKTILAAAIVAGLTGPAMAAETSEGSRLFTGTFDVFIGCQATGRDQLPDDQKKVWDEECKAPDDQARALQDHVGTPTAQTDAERQQIAALIEQTVRMSLVDVGAKAPYPCIPSPDTPSCVVAIGEGALLNATAMSSTIGVGHCSGATLRTESDDILVGDYTAAPRDKDGFVNIANRLCFWRNSGERVDCPPPEPECVRAK